MLNKQMSNSEVWKIFTADHERTVVKKNDRLNRFLFSEVPKLNLEKPIVSDYLYNFGFRPHYPENRTFAVCISHDVDHLFNPDFKLIDRAKAAGRDFLKGNWSRTLRYLNLKDPINPNYNIDELVDWEAKKKIKSSFYFLSLKQSEQDFNYDLEKIQPLINRVLRQGAEVGLHGGHEAFQNLQRISAEKNRLEENCKIPIRGYRNHFLRFDVPYTWNILEHSGFKYDTTFGFPDHPGYRNGMCYPFFPYNHKEDRFFDVLEIPLMAMDATFIYYLKWNGKQTLVYLKQMVDEIKKVNGVFTLLWHNNYLFEPWSTVFTSIVDYCIAQDAWFASGIELNNWWRENDFCSQYRMLGLHGNH